MSGAMAHDDEDSKSYPFSASQISTFNTCRTKWGWTYIVGLRSVGTPSTELGTRVHKTLENYIQGADIDTATQEGKIAITGVGHLPAPGTQGLRAEQAFTLPSTTPNAPWHWRGAKDLEMGDTVYDHKTTSDWRWAKTPEDLLGDPQAILYAAHNQAKTGGDQTQLNWVYYKTRTPHASKIVHLTMYKDHAQNGLAVLDSLAAEAYKYIEAVRDIDEDAKRKYVLAMPNNPGACEDFGGCPFRGLCNLSPTQRFAGKMSQANMSIIAKMKARAAEEDAKPAIVEVPVAPNVEVPINPPEAPPPIENKPFDPPTVKVRAARKSSKSDTSDTMPAPANDAQSGWTLYVDCVPLFQHGVLQAESLFTEAKKLISVDLGLDDYRFAEFGKGPGILECMVTKILDLQEAAGLTAVYVDSREPQAQVCLSLLKGRAARLVVSTK